MLTAPHKIIENSFQRFFSGKLVQKTVETVQTSLDYFASRSKHTTSRSKWFRCSYKLDAKLVVEFIVRVAGSSPAAKDSWQVPWMDEQR
jgi:hypothetical protein